MKCFHCSIYYYYYDRIFQTGKLKVNVEFTWRFMDFMDLSVAIKVFMLAKF